MNGAEQSNHRPAVPQPAGLGGPKWGPVAKYGTVGLAILLAFVFLFRLTFEDWIIGYLRDLLKDKPHYFAVAIFCGLVALLFSAIGAFLATVLRQHFKEMPSVAGQIKHDHDSAQRMLRDWMGTANGVLSQAAKGALREMWLSHPWEYMALLEEADKECQSKYSGQHIASVALHGTMVGFAFLLPEALRNHACRVKGQFKELEIFASDAVIEVSGQPKSLVHYPLWLVARLAYDLTCQCDSFCDADAGQSPPKLTITIAYYPHDILNAVIHLPPRQVVALQALDNDGFKRVLQGEELQVGFRHFNASERPEAYERFEAALLNLRRSIWRKKEVWSVSSDAARGPIIEVTNAHWTYDEQSNKATLMTDSKTYDESPASTLKLEGKARVEKAMNALLQAIRSEGHSGNDVNALEKLVAEKRAVWQRRHQMECPCKYRAQQQQQQQQQALVAAPSPANNP